MTKNKTTKYNNTSIHTKRTRKKTKIKNVTQPCGWPKIKQQNPTIHQYTQKKNKEKKTKIKKRHPALRIHQLGAQINASHSPLHSPKSPIINSFQFRLVTHLSIVQPESDVSESPVQHLENHWIISYFLYASMGLGYLVSPGLFADTASISVVSVHVNCN